MPNIAKLATGLTAIALTVAMSPVAAADPTVPLDPAQVPGLEAVQNLSPVVQQAAADPGSAQELLLAAEYILDAGNRQVMLCERGIRTFETHTRFTLPLATVPWLHARTHLPVVVDPSHGTGHANLVESMAAASVAAGADGLIVEVHPDPKCAASDAAQTLDIPAFQRLMDVCRRIATAVGRTLD